jgi:outer membrane lipoprotein-sorting protein
MKRQKNSSTDIVDAAVEAVRSAPVPDGPPPALRSALVAAVNHLDPATLSHLTFERKTAVKRIMQGSIAAIIVLVALGWASGLLFPRNDNALLADVVRQIQAAKTVKWTTVFYRKVVRKDGSKPWVEQSLDRNYHKAPDKYRMERLDAQGQLESVQIDDGVAGKRFAYDMKTHRAQTINRTPLREDEKAAFDPLTRLRNQIDRDAVPLGKKKINGGELVGYRVMQDKSRPDSTVDLWIDPDSRQLFSVLLPGAQKFDPETDPLVKNPRGRDGERTELLGLMLRNIVFDANLEDSLFSFEPPKGFANEVKTKHDPTEKDVIEWFGVLSQAHGNVFPPDIKESIELLNKFLRKNDRDRTPAEQKLIDQQNLADQGLVYPYPIPRFVSRLPKGDWHYAGNGVKQGDGSKAIFWYKPNGSKTWRVVLGDLKVKDAAAENLPK